MDIELKQKICEFYDAIGPFIEANNIGRPIQAETYRCCLIASLVKSFEFNKMTAHCEDSTLAFFQIPVLRSICEDFITLKFLSACPETDRNEIVHWLMLHELAVNVKTQENYFLKTRPFQRVLGPKQISVSARSTNRKLMELAQRQGWELGRGKHFPSTSWMAKQCDLEEIYSYIYDITSDWVHFNPGTLLRMGWGASMEKMSFSTKNFSGYYQAFALIYGTHLFCQMVQAFSSQIPLDENTKALIAAIEYLLSIEPRWPEIVTFEEMNVPRPEMGILEMMVLSIRRLQGYEKKP